MPSTSEHAYQVPGKLEIPFRYFAGKCGSQFLTALRDRKKILATRCPACNLVLVPARSLCTKCYARLDQMIEVGPGGVIASFTVVRYAEPHQPVKPPFVMALVKLDGADTSLTHIVAGVAPEKVSVGMRVEAVFADERKARITDIAYFRPAAAKAEKPKAEKAAAPKPKAAKKASKKAAKKAEKKVEKRPVKKTAKKAAKKAAKKKTKPATKKAVKKPAKETAKKTVKKPAKKVAKKVVKKPAKKSVKKVVKKVVKKPVKKMAKKTAKKAVKKAGRKK